MRYLLVDDGVYGYNLHHSIENTPVPIERFLPWGPWDPSSGAGCCSGRLVAVAGFGTVAVVGTDAIVDVNLAVVVVVAAAAAGDELNVLLHLHSW